MKIKVIFLAATAGLFVACGSGTTDNGDGTTPDTAQQDPNADPAAPVKKERAPSHEVPFESMNGAELANLLGFYVEGKDRLTYQGYYSMGEGSDARVSGPFKFSTLTDDGNGTMRKVDYKGLFETGQRDDKWIYRVLETKDSQTLKEFSIGITYNMDACVSSSVTGIIHPDLPSMKETFEGDKSCDFETLYNKINTEWGGKMKEAEARKMKAEGQ
jgi:hypothetical protein